MEKQTLLVTALPNGRAPDGSLRISVFLAPRLWSDEPAVTKLPLNAFADWLDWPAKVGGAAWSVSFDGGPPLSATVESPAPSSAHWQALFQAGTDVVPFLFEDYRGTAIESIRTSDLLDVVAGIYGRATSDPAYGAGRHKPSIETLAADPDLSAIARPTTPPKPIAEEPREPPLQTGGEPPNPNPPPPPPSPTPGPTPTPAPTGSDGCAGCGCGCLTWPWAILVRLFPGLKKLLPSSPGPVVEDDLPSDQNVVSSTPIPTPSFPIPGPAAPAAASATAAPPVVPFMPKPPLTPAGAAKMALFDEVAQFVEHDGVSVTLPGAAQIEDIYDFHRMMAALGDYPVLMRLLGVVVDLRVDAPAAGAAQGTVSVAPGVGLTPTGTIVSPRTHYELDADYFRAQPRSVQPEISSGLLRLQDDKLFRLVQADAVGASLKVQNAATNFLAFARKEKRAPNMPDDGGLPALRSAGLSVVRRDPVSELQSAFERSCALQAKVAALDLAPQPPPPPAAGPSPAESDELFAEDVVRGYRVEVFDMKLASWRSLCRRQGRYDFTGAAGLSFTAEDEGFVQFGATEKPPAAAGPSTLKTTDAIFNWDGWSLSAPRPGKTILKDDAAGATVLGELKNDAKTKFQLETNFRAVSGSLPRLRFAGRYRLRARVCDLAGNSAPAADDAAEQTGETVYRRYEPVSPPAMMLRASPVEAESVERLVVRAPGEGTERHLIPPKTSQLMAEQHGKFDGVPSMDGTVAGYDLATRERGRLEENAETVPGHAEIWIHPAAQFKLTYLPDPSARGVLLMGLPGLGVDEVIEPAWPVVGGKVVDPAGATEGNKFPYAGAWPDLQPFRLRLVGIGVNAVPLKPRYEAGVLEVQLPVAAQATVRISSYFNADDLDQQGVWSWTRQVAPPNLATLKSDALAGRSWAHLPWRELTLVHAVLQPVEPPALSALAATKEVNPATGTPLGATTAIISGTLTSHAASTGKVDVLAAWSDPVDDVHKPAPTEENHTAHLCETFVHESHSSQPLSEGTAQKPNARHPFHDTKHHAVSYTPVATTRFREYFPASVTSVLANVTLTGPAAPPIDVLNSARPDLPAVLYVVPTFAWTETAPAMGQTDRTRRSGLRVYLDRPWYSSGAGELLGVVFVPGLNFVSLDEPLRKLVTQWGADPIWLSAPPETGAQPASFEKPAGQAAGLTLAEHPQLVSVAGYTPAFDPERRLWFADLRLNVGDTYMPFVRLALVRFQPKSEAGAHLSRVVQADFAQLTPDRAASIVLDAARTKVTVTVSGPTYEASGVTRANTTFGEILDPGSGRVGRAEIEVELQKRDPGLRTDDRDLGWTLVSTTRLTQKDGLPGVWTDTIPLNIPLTPGDFRLLLKEYEWHRTDHLPEPLERATFRTNPPRFERRIVYAEQFPLS